MQLSALTTRPAAAGRACARRAGSSAGSAAFKAAQRPASRKQLPSKRAPVQQQATASSDEAGSATEFEGVAGMTWAELEAAADAEEAAGDVPEPRPQEEEEEDDEDYEGGAREAGPSRSPKAAAYELPDDDEESRGFAVAMAKVADAVKGEDLLLLHVAPIVYWTRYMLLVTVFSRPQLNALLGRMEKAAAEDWGRTLASNGQPGRTAWELLDYGDVVIHVMTAEQREYYDLETFYGAASEVQLELTGGEADAWQTSL